MILKFLASFMEKMEKALDLLISKMKESSVCILYEILEDCSMGEKILLLIIIIGALILIGIFIDYLLRKIEYK